MFPLILLAAALAGAPPRASSSAPAPAQTARFAEVSRRAEAARAANDVTAALRLYKEAVSLRPAWEEGWWYVGTLSYDLDLYADARDAFQRFVTVKADGGAGWAFLGLCEFRLGQFELSLEHVERALQLGVGQPQQLQDVTRYHAGILLSRFGRFEQAWGQLETLAKKNDDNVDVVNAIGIALLRLPLLPQEVPQERRELVLLAGRAAYAHAAQRIEPAQLAYAELLRRFGDTPNVHYGYGVFMVNGDADAALAEWKKEIEVSPSHLEARLQLAYEYLKRGEFELARPYAEQAVRIAPQHFAARNAYGRVLLGLGDVSGAIRELEAGVAIAPGSAPLRFALKNAYAQAGRAEDARREGDVFQQMESARRAIVVAENDAKAKPDDPAVRRALAAAYRSGRREDEAKRELRIAEQLEERAARSPETPAAPKE